MLRKQINAGKMKLLSVLFTLAICAVMIGANNEVNESLNDSANGSFEGLNPTSNLLSESDERSTETLVGDDSKKVKLADEHQQLERRLNSLEDITVTKVVGEIVEELLEKVSLSLKSSESPEVKEDALKEEALVPEFNGVGATCGNTILEPGQKLVKGSNQVLESDTKLQSNSQTPVSAQELIQVLESGPKSGQEFESSMDSDQKSDTKPESSSHNTGSEEESTQEDQDPSGQISILIPTPESKTSQIPLYKRIFKFLNRYIGLFSTLTASVYVLSVFAFDHLKGAHASPQLAKEIVSHALGFILAFFSSYATISNLHKWFK